VKGRTVTETIRPLQFQENKKTLLKSAFAVSCFGSLDESLLLRLAFRSPSSFICFSILPFLCFASLRYDGSDTPFAYYFFQPSVIWEAHPAWKLEPQSRKKTRYRHWNRTEEPLRILKMMRIPLSIKALRGNWSPRSTTTMFQIKG
jgi:hypothetical protein